MISQLGRARIASVVVAVIGAAVIVGLLATGGTHRYRVDSDDRYRCHAVLGEIRSGSDYPGYYDEIGEDPAVDHEDDLRLQRDHAGIVENCDRYRQRRLGWSLLLALPTMLSAALAVRLSHHRSE